MSRQKFHSGESRKKKERERGKTEQIEGYLFQVINILVTERIISYIHIFFCAFGFHGILLKKQFQTCTHKPSTIEIHKVFCWKWNGRRKAEQRRRRRKNGLKKKWTRNLLFPSTHSSSQATTQTVELGIVCSYFVFSDIFHNHFATQKDSFVRFFLCAASNRKYFLVLCLLDGEYTSKVKNINIRFSFRIFLLLFFFLRLPGNESQRKNRAEQKGDWNEMLSSRSKQNVTNMREWWWLYGTRLSRNKHAIYHVSSLHPHTKIVFKMWYTLDLHPAPAIPKEKKRTMALKR